MRKSLISALYGIYSVRGRIDIHKTLKELGIDDRVKLTKLEQSAIIQDLLKARSGVYIPAFGEAKSMKNERPARGSHPPNTFFYYNNWDFNVLGSIFQQETGLNLFKAFNESLAKPLQMEDFRPLDGRFWRDSSASTIYPKYDIKMSARDLARFGVLYCTDGIWDHTRILSQDWIKESFTPYSTMDHPTYKESYGYLWWIQMLDDTIPMYSALGWGGHIVVVVPKYDLVLVKRHDTFGGNGGDTKSGMYIRNIINARVSTPVLNPKLIPLEVRDQRMNFIDIPEATIKKYQQQIALNGRTRKIEYNNYGLVFDDWFVLHPVSETQFYIEDLNKYMFFKFVDDKPIFDRIE
jgi:CubicO group peptidase (beta-lactamase class C family)